MTYSLVGLDPILRLRSRLGVRPPNTGVEKYHPALKIAGLIENTGPSLDYALTLPANAYVAGPPTIVMVGCGGTGSHLLPNILMYAASKAKSNPATPIPHIIIIDGDIIEEKNLIRQRFSPGELGMSKAEALASRYSAVFGTKITAVNGYLTSSTQLNDLVFSYGNSRGPVIVIGAVDNHRARCVIYSYYLNSQNPVYWIDAGNEAWHGQVILGIRGGLSLASSPPWNEAAIGDLIGSVDLPCFFDVYPNDFLAIGKTPRSPQNECAALAIEDPQTIHANMLSAQCASALVTQVLSGSVKTMSLNFDAKTGATKARILTRENIAEGLAEQKSSRNKIRDFMKGLSLLGNPDGDSNLMLEIEFPGLVRLMSLTETKLLVRAQ